MRKRTLTEATRLRIVRAMSMRVNVTLGDEEMAALVKIMADMPPSDADGRPVSIGPADAIRAALLREAERLRLDTRAHRR
jgi:hypothetical protein